jgi:hypothetical protein
MEVGVVAGEDSHLEDVSMTAYVRLVVST